ncbi:calpain-12 isoform X2 [Hemiscyllium ocellatum]|uniref:calpain-12 isoform X2 n=1 Tax=Hemiscyllium ocellatum TaxID=170820 RepID=UPI0029668A0D|nr:calpain-12 isoform X2 [Hemiscyllium ocellatum]
MGNTDSGMLEDVDPSLLEEPEKPPRADSAGSRENPVKFQGQDFEQIRSQLLRDRRLFEDPKFPAGAGSLGPVKETGIEWVRASELFSTPQFFVDSVNRTDIRQGRLGDCWFLAAMSSLTLDEKLFTYTIPTDQSFQQLYAGIFHFRFWQYGKWVEVVVDDQLPVKNRRLIFTSSSSRNELWSALLEKAYAKLYGSYSSLVSGNVSEAMEDFTGGIAVSLKLSSVTPDELWMSIKRAFTKQSLASCSIEAANQEDVEKDHGLGLMKAHAYAITGADTVKYDGSSIRLFRLRNPWGRKEYNGPWSDRSQLWNAVSENEKAKLQLMIKEDGEFWMPAKILAENFTQIELCNLQPLCLHSTDCLWTITSHEGKWMAGISAGGCTNEDTFSTNPQYRLRLFETDDDPDDEELSCTIAVELLQKFGRKKDKIDFYYIGFYIYAFQNQHSRFGKKFFRRYRPEFDSGNYINSRSVARRLQLPPGEYVILPTTFNKNEEGEFFLRIFAKKNNVSRENSTTTSAFNPEVNWTEVDVDNKSALNVLKDAVSETDTLSASEFMELFNSATSDTYHLSLETCCSLVFAVNSPGQHGCLSPQEAKLMVVHVEKLQGIFDQFVDREAGLMNSHDLRPALSDAGFELDSKVHHALWMRHRTSTNTICFSHFVSCVAKLQKLFAIYERLKNPQPKAIHQWLLLFIGI